jgi:hypothetical protein
MLSCPAGRALHAGVQGADEQRTGRGAIVVRAVTDQGVSAAARVELQVAD